MPHIGYIFLTNDNAGRITVEDQRRAILAYGSERDVQVAEIRVDEGGSLRQAVLARPEGRKMIEEVHKGDTIVVVRAAYILGSPREGAKLLAELRRREVSLICLDLGEDISLDCERRLAVSKGGAVLVQQVLAALALCEDSRHSEAIKAAKRNRRLAGKYPGGPVPFGWHVDDEGRLVEHPEQQRIILEMARMRQDRWSYRDIALKIRENHGLRFSHEGIRRILGTNQRKREAGCKESS